MKPVTGTVVFDNRAHHMPIALFLGLLSLIETWLDHVSDELPMGVQFHAAGTTALYTVNWHAREGILPKSVGWQSDYIAWESYIPETDMRGIIHHCRQLANTDHSQFDTVVFVMDDRVTIAMLESSEVFHAPDYDHPFSSGVVN